MERTNNYLEAEQTKELDRVATAEGISRAELIRRLLERGLRAGPGDLESDLAAISSTEGALADLIRLTEASTSGPQSGIGLGDYLIAATAEMGGYERGTLHVRHFPMFGDLQPPFSLSDRSSPSDPSVYGSWPQALFLP